MFYIQPDTKIGHFRDVLKSQYLGLALTIGNGNGFIPLTDKI